MYMAPIIRTKAPVSTIARRATGAVVPPLSVAFMVPFLAVYAAYAGLALSARTVARAPRALLDMIDYTGTAILGR
ncbi:hypothetical protein GCM10009087_29330 [Sphingomonas oligophenolica]|uniref:Uncharacterized protein n=1 Tax=Sphingomonas oligophenolica TaxID=301154 RepID=A0ABU9YB79_9SPHN